MTDNGPKNMADLTGRPDDEPNPFIDQQLLEAALNEEELARRNRQQGEDSE
jgi:hypothetical protein